MISQFITDANSEFQFHTGSNPNFPSRLAAGKLDKKCFGFNESSLKQDLEYDQLIINPRTDWSLIADRLIEPISRPVNLRRTSSANNTNPWGSTVSIIRI